MEHLIVGHLYDNILDHADQLFVYNLEQIFPLDVICTCSTLLGAYPYIINTLAPSDPEFMTSPVVKE